MYTWTLTRNLVKAKNLKNQKLANYLLSGTPSRTDQGLLNRIYYWKIQTVRPTWGWTDLCTVHTWYAQGPVLFAMWVHLAPWDRSIFISIRHRREILEKHSMSEILPDLIILGPGSLLRGPSLLLYVPEFMMCSPALYQEGKWCHKSPPALESMPCTESGQVMGHRDAQDDFATDKHSAHECCHRSRSLMEDARIDCVTTAAANIFCAASKACARQQQEYFPALLFS